MNKTSVSVHSSKLFLMTFILTFLSRLTLASSSAVIQSLPPLIEPKQAGHWVKQKEVKGFTIYLREGAATDILPIKVEGILTAPIDVIMETLRQVDGSEVWTPDLLKKVTLRDLGPRAAITYSLTDMPWPIYDRRLVLHNELYLDKKHQLLFVISKTVPFQGAPAPKRTIEAFVGYSNIGFRPIDRNRTYVELTAFIDPRGSIPSWIINFYQKSWPIKFLEALELRAQTHRVGLRKGLQKMLRDLLTSMNWDPKTFDTPSQ